MYQTQHNRFTLVINVITGKVLDRIDYSQPPRPAKVRSIHIQSVYLLSTMQKFVHGLEASSWRREYGLFSAAGFMVFSKTFYGLDTQDAANR